MHLIKEGGKTVRTVAETAATADLIMADQHDSQHNNLIHAQMQPEDIREQLAGEVPLNIVCTVTACEDDR